MYMPHLHNHEEWAARRSKYNADWKDKQQAKKNSKSETDAADPPTKSDGGNLFLAKSFKCALATHVMLSNQEANQLGDDVINGKFNEYYELKE